MRFGRQMMISVISLAVCAGPAVAQQGGAGARKSAVELAADVVRTTQEYRAVLERALPGYEAELHDATEALQERQELHTRGILPSSYVEEAERAWSTARRNLDEARMAIQEADNIILEASVQQQLARLAPLPRGGYQDTATLVRFNGRSSWSLQGVPKLEQVFAATFGRSLPISSLGQTKVHDRLGLDHRAAIDVAVHPDSPEGRWLMQYLRQADIPFIGVRSAVPGSSTGAHVHVGMPSARVVAH